MGWWNKLLWLLLTFANGREVRESRSRRWLSGPWRLLHLRGPFEVVLRRRAGWSLSTRWQEVADSTDGSRPRSQYRQRARRFTLGFIRHRHSPLSQRRLDDQWYRRR